MRREPDVSETLEDGSIHEVWLFRRSRREGEVRKERWTQVDDAGRAMKVIEWDWSSGHKAKSTRYPRHAEDDVTEPKSYDPSEGAPAVHLSVTPGRSARENDDVDPQLGRRFGSRGQREAYLKDNDFVELDRSEGYSPSDAQYPPRPTGVTTHGTVVGCAADQVETLEPVISGKRVVGYKVPGTNEILAQPKTQADWNQSTKKKQRVKVNKELKKKYG